ncbi:hypothetical protein SKAU_G00404830 [Synaphobranchus kaupii]|uniref:Uncharacterized protein n=1 Tax=Synaphobranchus kaupii TaxID=118154 RepID=A0A9Q1ICP9_SYNKA|nr:hypothetical protein SKAU_G00404830 [Synaphobranchus kaupii]
MAPIALLENSLLGRHKDWVLVLQQRAHVSTHDSSSCSPEARCTDEPHQPGAVTFTRTAVTFTAWTLSSCVPTEPPPPPPPSGEGYMRQRGIGITKTHRDSLFPCSGASQAYPKTTVTSLAPLTLHSLKTLNRDMRTDRGPAIHC